MSRWQRGDTIVEVLIAIAIISAVLGGAYVATNKALRAGRAAQERSEGLEVAKEQLERIRYVVVQNLGDPSGQDLFSIPTAFCLDASLHIVNISNVAVPAGYSASCRPDPTSRYGASIERTGSFTEPVFVVRVLWENVTGGSSTVHGTSLPGYDSVELKYRIRG